MNSINFAFIIQPNEYDPQCYSCVNLWKNSDKTVIAIKTIMEKHRGCHGWNHCHIDCCGPCPTCGYCDGLDDDDWEIEEITGNVRRVDPEYQEAFLKDTTELDWDIDAKYH